MLLTECFEMSAHRIQILENNERIQQFKYLFCISCCYVRVAKEPNYLKSFNLNCKRNFSIPNVFCLGKFLCATQLPFLLIIRKKFFTANHLKNGGLFIIVVIVKTYSV
jgi:hypothetical protein